MYLIDIYQERARWLYFEEGHPTDVQWIGNGCELYITLTDWDSYGQKVIRADLAGNILENDLESTVKGLSPSGEWRASLRDSGELWGRDGIPEFQDLVITPVEADEEGFILSENRGVDEYAWSPDGQLIAYSDYDEHNVLQMYVSDIDERSRLPISQFTEGVRLPQQLAVDNAVGANMSEPVWSPDSDLLAYVHFGFYRPNELNRVGSVWIISPGGGWQYKISHETIPTEPVDTWTASILGWSDDSSVLAFTLRVRRHGSLDEMYVYWVNAYNGSIVRHLTISSLIEEPTYLPIAIAGIDTLLIRSQVAGEGYVYDYATETVTPIQIPVLGEPDLIHFKLATSPSDFPGEAACKITGQGILPIIRLTLGNSPG